MASPPRRVANASTTPPFTPLRSPVQRARASIEEKVARQLAVLPGPDEEEAEQEVSGEQEPGEAARVFAASPRQNGDESDGQLCGDDDAMMQYLGSMDGSCSGAEESDAGSEDASFEIGMLGCASAHATDESTAATQEPATTLAVVDAADGVPPPAESQPSRTPHRLSAVSSAVPALFTGCDPVRMRQQISLLTRQVQRGEDTAAALQARLTQAKIDRDRSELSNVELRGRADAVRQHVCLLKAQIQQLSGVQAPTLEELRGEMLNQAQNDAGVLARKLAEQQQLVRQLYAQLEDQALTDSSERESLASEVERCAEAAKQLHTRRQSLLFCRILLNGSSSVW
eukprot:COSAG02_NODE_1819_length_10773_cov_6.699550_6_plen_342_part_00